MRVVIAQDLSLLRPRLTRILSTHDVEVVEAVNNGPSLVRALITHRPDVSVIDVRLPPTYTDEGLRAALDVRARIPSLPVIMLSPHVEQLHARELISDQAGAVGYLLKDRVANVEEFVEILHRVAAGATVMDPNVIASLLNRHESEKLLQTLTTREREVLTLMAEGRSNTAIASRMPLSEKAVRKHTNSISAKLGLERFGDSNGRALAILAYLLT